MKITKARLKEIINEETSKVYAQHKTTYVEITEKELRTLKEHNIKIPKNVILKRQHLNEAAPVVAAGASAGLRRAGVVVLEQVIVEFLSTSEGRNQIADILTSVPEMVDALCAFGPDLGVETGESIATALGGEQPTFVSSIASTIKFLCGFFIKTSLYPLTSTLNLLAYILRLLSDEQAKIIIDSSRGQEVEEEPVIDPDDTEVPLENA